MILLLRYGDAQGGLAVALRACTFANKKIGRDYTSVRVAQIINANALNVAYP